VTSLFPARDELLEHGLPQEIRRQESLASLAQDEVMESPGVELRPLWVCSGMPDVPPWRTRHPRFHFGITASYLSCRSGPSSSAKLAVFST